MQPRLVGEVGFRHWTEEGRLANPVWHRLRPDAHPARVRPAVVLGGGAPEVHLADDTADAAEAEAAAAELRALREQISPHFVYNALNTVASLVRTDPARARELLGEFADFTRYAFRTAAGLTTLGEELDAVARYLAVEQARFGARLRTDVQVPEQARAVAVPFLAVQSLVVDAVRNGIEPAASGGTVTIRVTAAGAECTVRVGDDGVRRPDGAVHDVGERLRAEFGGRATVDVANTAEARTVTLRVPRRSPASA